MKIHTPIATQAKTDFKKNTYSEITASGAPGREGDQIEQPLCEKLSHWYFLPFVNVKLFLSCGGEAEFQPGVSHHIST